MAKKSLDSPVKVTSDKKTPKKKAVAKNSFLKDTKPDSYFILRDGRAIKSLPELAMFLEDMPDDIFYHHVNGERNDFANWISDCIREPELVERISGARDKRNLQLEILKYMVIKLR